MFYFLFSWIFAYGFIKSIWLVAIDNMAIGLLALGIQTKLEVRAKKGEKADLRTIGRDSEEEKKIAHPRRDQTSNFEEDY